MNDSISYHENFTDVKNFLSFENIIYEEKRGTFTK